MGDLNAFVSDAVAIYEAFAKGGLVAELNRNLEALQRFGRLADASSSTGIAVTRFRPLGVSVTLHKMGDAQSPICELGAHLFIASMGPGKLVLEVYQSDASPPDVFDPDRVATFVERVELEAGDWRTAAAHRHMLRILPSEAPAIALAVASKQQSSYMWEYDPQTLRPAKFLNASLADTRLQYAARALAEFGDAESVDVLDDLLAHDNYSVRWEALKALMRLDPTSGIAALSRALRDRHPMIRDAAERTFEQNPGLMEAR